MNIVQRIGKGKKESKTKALVSRITDALKCNLHKQNVLFSVDKLICVLSVKPIESWQGLYPSLILVFSVEWENVNATA